MQKTHFRDSPVHFEDLKAGSSEHLSRFKGKYGVDYAVSGKMPHRAADSRISLDRVPGARGCSIYKNELGCWHVEFNYTLHYYTTDRNVEGKVIEGRGDIVLNGSGRSKARGKIASFLAFKLYFIEAQEERLKPMPLRMHRKLRVSQREHFDLHHSSSYGSSSLYGSGTSSGLRY